MEKDSFFGISVDKKGASIYTITKEGKGKYNEN